MRKVFYYGIWGLIFLCGLSPGNHLRIFDALAQKNGLVPSKEINIVSWTKNRVRQELEQIHNRDNCWVSFEPHTSPKDHLVMDGKAGYVHFHLFEKIGEQRWIQNGLLFRVRVDLSKRKVALTDPFGETVGSEEFVSLKGLVQESMLKWLIAQANQAIAEHKELLLEAIAGERANYLLYRSKYPPGARGIFRMQGTFLRIPDRHLVREVYVEGRPESIVFERKPTTNEFAKERDTAL